MSGNNIAVTLNVLIVVVLLLSSCHLFEEEEHNNVQVYFDESNVSVFTGGMGSLSLRIEPPETMEQFDVHYAILNENIAMIFRADRRGVVFYGLEKGSTVITARIGNAEAKAVINVVE